MTETYLYYNGKLLETLSGENTKKAIMALLKAVKFEVIINSDNGRYIFEVKLDEAEWKLKKMY